MDPQQYIRDLLLKSPTLMGVPQVREFVLGKPEGDYEEMEPRTPREEIGYRFPTRKEALEGSPQDYISKFFPWKGEGFIQGRNESDIPGGVNPQATGEQIMGRRGYATQPMGRQPPIGGADQLNEAILDRLYGSGDPENPTIDPLAELIDELHQSNTDTGVMKRY